MTNPNYAMGYHEAWEAWLHSFRSAALLEGRVLTHKEETKALEEWLTKNHAVASQHVICKPCHDAIHDAIFTGEEVFAVPALVRNAITEFSIKMRRRR